MIKSLNRVKCYHNRVKAKILDSGVRGMILINSCFFPYYLVLIFLPQGVINIYWALEKKSIRSPSPMFMAAL